MRVYVYSPHRFILESLELLLSSHYELVPLSEAEVAIRDLRGFSTPYPRPFEAPTLALIDGSHNKDAVAVLRAGYRGYLDRDGGQHQMGAALRAILRGENWAERSVLAAALEPKEALHLTPRESEVYQLLLLGHSNLAIAKSLGISVNTVKTHVSRILNEFNVPDRTELIRQQ